jgi:aldose 1-epimerase
MKFARLFPGCALVLLLAGLSACSNKTEDAGAMKPQPFGTTADGTEVFLYTLKNHSGMEAKITNYGGIVVSLRAPDRAGRFDDVVLGYDSLAGYLKETPYFGALIGRYGNRIGRGTFTLNGQEYALATNNGKNHLHGGLKGFDKVVWGAEQMETPAGPSLVLKYLSRDGEEGYPGNLRVQAVYTVTEANELAVEFSATTDKPTVVNLTHHSYFNLAGATSPTTVLDHVMMIDADRFTPIDSGLIPTGELRDVTGTSMDFRIPTAIGARINAADEQLRLGLGYDHNWVLNKKEQGMRLAVRVEESTTGRVLEVLTTEPGIQFYSGNFLDGTIAGKGGKTYVHRYGFCLEPQHFPDSPNRPDFPATVLNPGQTYGHRIMYRFMVK